MDHEQDGIKNLFEHHCSHLVFDSKLARKINEFQVGFVNKNEEHMTFFGGNLTGVQVVRFTSQDKDKWFTGILEADDFLMEEQLLELPAINPNFHVSTDIFNHSCFWLMHKFVNSNLLNDKQKKQAMLDTALVLYYRFITSLLFRYFRFPADPRVAEATYARLSYKFAIKKYGSWYATLEARCLDLVDEHGLHIGTITSFNDDGDIIRMINDSQGRIRDMLKNIYSVLKNTSDMGIKIRTTSSVIEHDGEEIFRDSTKNLTGYIRYINSIIADKNSFIKQELTDIICKVMHTMNPKLFLTTLEWCSNNYKYSSHKEVEVLIDETLTHSFTYLNNNRTVIKESTDLPGMLSKLRGVYMSSRSTEVELLKIRKVAEKIIKQATGTKNENAISSVRTGLLLYIVLRSFTMSYYSK